MREKKFEVPISEFKTNSNKIQNEKTFLRIISLFSARGEFTLKGGMEKIWIY